MNSDWKLKEIRLEFKNHGEYEGQYVGSVHFQNGDYESFRFKIRPDMAQAYINLIAKDVVKGADSLASRLIESLGLNNLKQ